MPGARRLFIAAVLVVACSTSAPPPTPPDAPVPVPDSPAPAPAPEPAPEEIRDAEEALEQVALAELATAPEGGGVVEVLFEAGSATLTPEARSALDALSAELPSSGDYYLEIQGHTDPSGSEEANLRLAHRRAEEVRLYLQKERGVPPDWMEIVALGPSAPIADNRTPEGRQRNRRAVVVVLGPPPSSPPT